MSAAVTAFSWFIVLGFDVYAVSLFSDCNIFHMTYSVWHCGSSFSTWFLRVFFFFCGRSAVLRPSAHMLPGIGCSCTGLPPFPTACWWLTHPAAIIGVSVSARWDSPGGCGGPSVPLLCNHGVQSPWCQFTSGVLKGHSVLFAIWI